MDLKEFFKMTWKRLAFALLLSIAFVPFIEVSESDICTPQFACQPYGRPLPISLLLYAANTLVPLKLIVATGVFPITLVAGAIIAYALACISAAVLRSMHKSDFWNPTASKMALALVFYALLSTFFIIFFGSGFGPLGVFGIVALSASVHFTLLTSAMRDPIGGAVALSVIGIIALISCALACFVAQSFLKKK